MKLPQGYYQPIIEDDMFLTNEVTLSFERVERKPTPIPEGYGTLNEIEWEA